MEFDQAKKPVPTIEHLTQPFWEGAAIGELRAQKCDNCGALNFYPKPWCIECQSRSLSWVQIRNSGVIYSYTTASAVMMNYPAWTDELPVTLCIIDTVDGVRMYGQLTNCEPQRVRIGMDVEAYFEHSEGDGGVIVPRFRPTSS